jgi:hypothetical protein
MKIPTLLPDSSETIQLFFRSRSFLSLLISLPSTIPLQHLQPPLSYKMVYSSDSSEIETCQDGGLELQYNSVNTLEGLKRVYYQSWFICLAATPMCGISAARRINTLFLQRWDNNTDSAHNIPETFLKLLRNMVVTLIEQVPHTHGGQRTMVNLILELQKIPQEEGRRVNVSCPPSKEISIHLTCSP